MELVTHQLNHRRLRSLGNQTPCLLFHGPARRTFHGATRQKISREIFDLFWQHLETMPERSPHQTRAAWRLIVEAWLRRQGGISVSDKQQPVSTHSNPFYSQN